MRALHRIRAGELPSTPVRAGLLALTRRVASTIRRCRGLQAKRCGQLSDYAKCKTHILRPGRGTDVDPRDETSLAILLPIPVRRGIVDSHSARVLSLRRRAAPTPTSYRLTLPHLILCAGALRPYPDALMPCQDSLHHHWNEWWTCAICRSCILARAVSRSPSAPSACQASPVNECRETLFAAFYPLDPAFAVFSRHVPATLSLRRLCVRTWLAAIRCSAASAVSRTRKHDTTVTQPAALHLTTLEQHRET